MWFEEVRGFRREHTQKFDRDLTAICDDLKSLEERSGFTIVRLEPASLKKNVLRDSSRPRP